MIDLAGIPEVTGFATGAIVIFVAA